MENEKEKQTGMPGECVIRRAVPADVPEIGRLLYQVHRVHSDVRPDLFRAGARKYTDEQVLAILADEKTPVFVAERGGRVVGYAFCIFKQFLNDGSMTDVKSLYVDDLCVDADVRGAHIGQALYRYVVDFAAQKGCYHVTLNVWAGNVNALRFYQKVGLHIQKYGMEVILPATDPGVATEKKERIRFERLTNPEHPMYPQAMALYRQSFPYHELREPLSQARILFDPAYRFLLIYDGEMFVGLLLYWEAEDFLYVEHFCILPELRNRRYGQKVLEELRRHPKTVILEIDPPEDAISIRRRGFYERNGFCENPYAYTHLPYHLGDTGHRLVIMSAPEPIGEETYASFLRFLKERVMVDAFGESTAEV